MDEDWLPLLPWHGRCPGCGHDWRDHGADGPSCTQCEYEMHYGLPGAPEVSCRAPDPVDEPPLDLPDAGGDAPAAPGRDRPSS